MLVTADIKCRSAKGDATHTKLKAAVEKRQRAHLWIPQDAITFVPRLSPVIYGDGRALFRITTCNQRPAYWIIRACSSWDESNYGSGPTFGEHADQIMWDLEDAFGRGRCGYSGNSLFWPRRERMQNCQCEECSERGVAKWPQVDDENGCSWGRMDWPAGFPTVPNPRSWQGNLLAAETQSK